MQFPFNYSNLKQIIGRVVRMKSHSILPLEEQKIIIKCIIYDDPGFKEVASESSVYLAHWIDYVKVLEYDDFLKKYAVDNVLNEYNIHNKSFVFKKPFNPYTLQESSKMENYFSESM